jgi:hypothetical protein
MKKINTILLGFLMVMSSISAFAQTASSCRVFISKSISADGSTKLTAFAFPTRTGISYKWSNGATTDNISTTQFGDYCVTITGSNCEAKTCVTLAPPSCGGGYTSTTNASGTTICLTSVVGKSFAWSNGETTKCITVTQAGEYCAVVKGDNCESKVCAKVQTATTTTSSTSCSVQISRTATATGFNLCASSITPGTYKWSTGDTSKCISVTKTGSYCVTITAKVGNCTSRGCTSVTVVPPVDTVKIDTIKIDTIKIDTIKVDTIKKDTTKTTTTTTVSTSCSVQISRTATSTGFNLCASSVTAGTYLWSTGDTSKCISVTKSGRYCVTITALVGNCRSTGCRTVTVVDTLGLQNVIGSSKLSNLSSEVSIESAGPNPVGNDFNVSLSSPTAQKITSKIFDINGKLQSQSEYNVTEGDNNLTFDMSNLNGGIYFINIITADKKEVLKVVKQ